jgi:hypothetical protein
MASLCVPAHRAWVLRYTRDRFRDPAGGLNLARLLSEGEEELERFVGTLRAAGRLPAAVERPSIDSIPSASLLSSSTQPGGTVAGAGPVPHPGGAQCLAEWDCAAVQRWLQSEVGLGADELALFEAHRVDGRLLALVDEEDLRGELGIGSRLLRKRILAAVSSLSREQ